MKLVLKILALPVLFVVKVICILGNLLTNVVSYVIGLLLLVIGGSAIYCIVKALWQSLLILVVLGIATIAAVFLLVWAVMNHDAARHDASGDADALEIILRRIEILGDFACRGRHLVAGGGIGVDAEFPQCGERLAS